MVSGIAPKMASYADSLQIYIGASAKNDRWVGKILDRVVHQ